MIKKIIKHLVIFKIFSKNCIIGYLEYRANFFMEFISECVYVLMKFIYVYSIYRIPNYIDGVLNQNYFLLLCGNYMLLTGFFVGFILMNFLDLSNQIRNGTLDLLIVKPISLQFAVSFRQFQFASAIPNVFVGGALLCLGLRGTSIVWPHVLLYVIMMICAMLLTYSIFLILQLASFWVVKAEALSSIFETIWDYNNMPMQIYPKQISIVLVYAIPLLVISNFPVIGLMGGLSLFNMLWTVVITIALFVLCRLLWNISVRKYSSASS